MEEFPPEIFSEITNHLSYVDTISLSWVSKACNEKTKKKDINLLIDNFISRPQYLGDDAGLFLKKLRESGEYISGSFLLKILYDADWECDLDVYKFVVEQTTDPISIEWGILIDSLLNTNPDIIQRKCGNRYEILGVVNRNFLRNDFKIDHTIVYNTSNEEKKYTKVRNYDSIFDFIDTMFDIDLCKIVYDGKKLYIKSKHNLVYGYSLAHSRLLDYDRIPSYSDDPPSIPELLSKMLNRVQKYKNRGFRIKKTYDVTKILSDHTREEALQEKNRHKLHYYPGINVDEEF